MSIIYSVICILFLSSTISALVAPPVVYSATIYNAQNSPIQCNIIWSKSSGDTVQSDLFTIEKNNNYFINEKTTNMGTWHAHAVIQEIHCGNLVLTAPFAGVKSPKKDWAFTVYPNEIVSGQSSSSVENY
jgi:hypothetical protein